MFCSLTTCPTNTFRVVNGRCNSCSAVSGPDGFATKVDSQKDCQACDNRMYVDGYCLLYQPGDYGVCNSDSPDPENFPNYPSGMGKLYRDVDWVCRSCTADASYKTTKAECESCGDLRQFNERDSYCFKAGCEETVTFLASNNRCQSCVLETAIEIADEADSKQLCTACGNRRIMQIDDKTYACALICGEDEWQTIKGECRVGVSDIDNEIGIDSVSVHMCQNADGQVLDKDGKKYCVPK